MPKCCKYGKFFFVNEADYKALFSVAAREFGRRGGRCKNPRKGFGSGDNARKAALARWAKAKRKKGK